MLKLKKNLIVPILNFALIKIIRNNKMFCSNLRFFTRFDSNFIWSVIVLEKVKSVWQFVNGESYFGGL